MADPIKVAHIMGKMVGGGLESVVMNYYRHIDRSRVQFDFIVDEDSTFVPRGEIESLGGHVFTVPPYQCVRAYQKSLIGLFQDRGWAIVHSHENALSVFPLRAAKKAGVPIRIAHSHSTSGKGEPVRNAMKWALRRFSNVYPTHRMACSQHAGEWLFGKGTDFDILYNAIELDRFLFNPRVREEVRTGLGISESSFVVGHIGRFVTQKNHTFLLDVFSRVVREGADAVLVLAGDGPLRSEIEQKAADVGVSGRVKILGQRDDVYKLYQAFDVFCLPSLYEGLGVVAVEAQASGLPCLLSTGVPTEVNVTGKSRFLPIGNSIAWADALCAAGKGKRLDVNKESFAQYDIVSASRRLANMYLNLASTKGCEAS